MKKIIIAILLIIPFYANSQKLIANRDSVQGAYNFWVYIPECYDSVSNTTPTVLFLHGRSLCGRNLSMVRKYGPLDALLMGRKINAVVVAPQNPGDAWKPEKIMKIIDWTTEKYHTDTNRLYVLGMSLGGYGTIDFAGTYPDKVAAAMALCGGGTLKNYCGLNEVPLWIMHGTADKAVGVSQSQAVVDKMIACGDTSRLIFDRLSGVNHSRLARMFYLPDTYEWLFSHSLADSARQVNRNVPIDNATMELAYKNLDKSSTHFKVVDPNPQAYSYVPDDPNATYYVIKKGDTLSHVARMYHTTVSKLCQINHLSETSILQIGQKIYLK
ncbi:MAG: LysM peptidoglycan-binding domain-containing protein [Bacteroidales bacterium]|nr:LysM peptidoglycan-binding domain-containing protein [Bacteroidales bacterium]